ncbi:transmembrane protein 45A-like [Trifolium pratense]|uniref:transmembrane protein 45A-like n=1 Tax=Trifolium pratense TaxID=57577 RepID=UPI001E696DDC|nr:transmembrane protein 45A-like [Trifolium pratense]
MGTLVGHVGPGFGFIIIGLWHLFNNIKLHVQNPNTYISQTWFPTSKFKYLELYIIMVATTASISMELFIGPDRHQPFDPDGTIPSNHLHNFEHASISITFFVYAAFSIILDKIENKAKSSLTQLLASVAFFQELLLFHLHSSDHMGPEGQYHLHFQVLIFVSLSTTLLGIIFQKSFIISFVRSLSIFSQGLWNSFMGFMLWTPSLISKGCFMNLEEGHKVVRCYDHESLHRALSLVNIFFSWFVIFVAVFGVSLYLLLTKYYEGDFKVRYFSLGIEEEEKEDYVEKFNDDVASQKGSLACNQKNFIHVEKKTFSSLDIER